MNEHELPTGEPYGPGKFEGGTDVDALVYQWALDGADESTGDSSEGPAHYDLVIFGDECRKTLAHLDEYRNDVAAILTEDSNGFVDVEYFTSVEDARTRWSEIAAEVETWYDDSEDAE